ncbi:uncharacterized protein LOC128229887 isoform X2 [Mya arenaria]|uniref:uncharacterized protein LOC128229887 isoform X2 n=1 Tax=Mya arenaria TaxID=6604 RepID=UPI0022E8CE16|nr:uncharacterized protein LOC128229887 isoform X2 [Mya arenaria]
MQYMIRRANYFYRGQVKRNLRYLSLSENRTMSSVESLPVLYIKASNHFDVGQAVGKTFKGFINDYMSDSKEVKMYRKFFNDPRGKPIVEQYLETSEKYHPDIMSEIRGIADGSGESFVDIFMLQLASEISMCHYDVLFPSEADSHSTPKGCTDVLVNRQSCRVIGHNEDWAFEVSSRVGIVHVTITGHGETKPMEQFLSYVFPGYLSGLTFGMNKHLVLTLNSLAPTQANVRGVPLQIVVRNLLTCDSISACVEMMASRPVGCGFGMNINIAEINTDKMCSVEVYSDKNGSSTDVHWAHDWVDGFYHHQNHYRRPREDMQAPVVAGSRIRYERVEEMTKEVPVAGVDDVRTILGDDKSERTPIYLTHSEKHSYKDGSTSATAIFDISNRVLHVYRANPRHSLPLASLPFIT